MEIGRRELLCGASLVAINSLVTRELMADIENRSVEERAEYAGHLEEHREQYRARNHTVGQQQFKIRIRNNYQWRLVFGIFGMTSPMQWRQTVDGGMTYQSSGGEIRGGERIAVVWDEWSRAVLDNQWVLVENDMTIEIDNAGVMSITQ